MNTSNEDLKLALHLADTADAITMASFGKLQAWTNKSDGSPVSEIDRAVEEALANKIATLGSGDSILGEERAADGATSSILPQGRQWVIDPIDQTRHYLRGNLEYATLISLLIDGRPAVSVVSSPALGVRWWASRGQGAYKNGAPLHVSQVTKIEDAYLSVAGIREWHSEWKYDELVKMINRSSYPAGSAGGFLQQMMVAEGLIDIFVEPWGEVWDHVGPSLIIEEAGGCSTTLVGGPPHGGSLVATNGVLHKESLQYLVRV